MPRVKDRHQLNQMCSCQPSLGLGGPFYKKNCMTGRHVCDAKIMAVSNTDNKAGEAEPSAPFQTGAWDSGPAAIGATDFVIYPAGFQSRFGPVFPCYITNLSS